ncbi:MAG: dihydropteroate synthase, partial [bacterium]
MTDDTDDPVSVRTVSFDTPAPARELMAAIGVHPQGVDIMAAKFTGRALYVKNLKTVAANILKQEALSAGAEAAVNKHVVTCRVARSDALLFGTAAALGAVGEKLAGQDFGLDGLGKAICRVLAAWDAVPSLELKGKTYRLERPLVTGILNVTPDSFSDGGRFLEPAAAVNRARELLGHGADVVDVGGESTRPGAAYVSAEEEL